MTIYSGFSHWKLWFSIAMLVYQRVHWIVKFSQYHKFNGWPVKPPHHGWPVEPSPLMVMTRCMNVAKNHMTWFSVIFVNRCSPDKVLQIYNTRSNQQEWSKASKILSNVPYAEAQEQINSSQLPVLLWGHLNSVNFPFGRFTVGGSKLLRLYTQYIILYTCRCSFVLFYLSRLLKSQMLAS